MVEASKGVATPDAYEGALIQCAYTRMLFKAVNEGTHLIGGSNGNAQMVFDAWSAKMTD